MPRKPNILVLMADQLTAGALPAYGNRVARTPHMDALAEGGQEGVSPEAAGRDWVRRRMAARAPEGGTPTTAGTPGEWVGKVGAVVDLLSEWGYVPDLAVTGQEGDVTNDSTALWPEESRRSVKLGTIAVAEIVPRATCDAFTFDPVVVPDGMAGPADDPLFEIRSPAYAVSITNRQ